MTSETKEDKPKKSVVEVLTKGGEFSGARAAGLAKTALEHKEDFNYDEERGCVPVNTHEDPEDVFIREVYSYARHHLSGDIHNFLDERGHREEFVQMVRKFYRQYDGAEERWKKLCYWCKDGDILDNIWKTEKAGRSPEQTEKAEKEARKGKAKGTGDSKLSDRDNQTGGHYADLYPRLYEIGVITDKDGVVRSKLRGVVLAFLKDVEEIYGTDEDFHPRWAYYAFLKWGKDKFPDFWFAFIMEEVGPVEMENIIAGMYASTDEVSLLCHDKYEYVPELTVGNAITDDVPLKLVRTEDFSPEPVPDDFDQADYWVEEEEKEPAEEEVTGVTEKTYPCSKCSFEGESTSELMTHLSRNPLHRKGRKGADAGPSRDEDGRPPVEQGPQDGKLADFADEYGSYEKGQRENGQKGVRHKANGDLSAFGGDASNGAEDKQRGETNGREGSKKEDTPSGETSGEGTGADGRGGDNTTGGVGETRTGKQLRNEEQLQRAIDNHEFPKPKNVIIHGNSAKILPKLGKGFVDCCVTSPPYWQLRDYEGHIEDDWDGGEWVGQLGHEPHPDIFVNHLCDIFDGVKRVLKPGGSCWVNLGDTYSGKSGGYYDNDEYEGGSIGHTGNRPALGVDNVLPEKCLAMVPERFALEMINRGWILRNKIVWAKQVIFEDDDARGISMPTAAKDRVVEKSAEAFYHFVKQKDYYYNLDAIRRPHKTKPKGGKHYSRKAKMTKTENHGEASHDLSRNFNDEEFYSEGGANIPRVWQVNLVQSTDEHYASYPPNLVRRPILATCPEGGLVLDPFAGTGTTLKWAADHNRNYLGIEFSDKYIDICRRQVPKSIQQGLV